MGFSVFSFFPYWFYPWTRKVVPEQRGRWRNEELNWTTLDRMELEIWEWLGSVLDGYMYSISRPVSLSLFKLGYTMEDGVEHTCI